MKILSISTDRNIFNEKSEVRRRIVDYGGLVDEFCVIVFSKKEQGFQDQQISNNVWVYPTNSKNKYKYIFNAIKIGKKIIKNWKFKIENSSNNIIITSQDPFETGWVGWWIAKKFELSLQIQIHTDLLSPHFIKESLKNNVRVRVAKFLIPKADGIRVVSKRIRNSIISQFYNFSISKITTLPIFIDIERIKNIPITINLHKRYKSAGKIILMASRITREKNIDLAIKAVKEVVKKYPKTLLLIVGEGSEKEKLMAKSRNLKANVKFEKTVSFEELISYYKTADIFLLTSNYEGYGMTLAEVATVGRPIISTDVGVAKEIQNAKLVPIGDFEALKITIIEQIENPRKTFSLEIGSYQDYLNKMKKSWKVLIK